MQKITIKDMKEKVIKNRTHGLSERELAKLLMEDCKTTRDVQAKLKRLFGRNNRANA